MVCSSCETEETEPALGVVLTGRAQTYRLLSRLFLRPLDEGEIAALAAEGLEARAGAFDAEGLLARGYNDMGRGLHRRHTGTAKLLGTDFTMAFDGVASLRDERAVPYASVFIGAKTGDKAELFQAPRAADRAAYRREGVKVDESLNLPDDHLSFELSFMADLSDKTAAALAAGDGPEALRLIDVSDEFRREHILAWYGLFFDLAMQLVQTRFYRGVLEATFGYLELDGEVLADLREEAAS